MRSRPIWASRCSTAWGRRVVLTEAGRRLLGYANGILAAVEEAATMVPGRDAESPTGSLTITALETLATYRLPTLLTQFRARYPGVQVAFQFSRVTALRRNVIEGTVDVAFSLEPPISDPALAVELLSIEQLLVVAAPNHSLASAPVVRPADLARVIVLLNEPGCAYRGLFLHLLAAAGVQPELPFGFNGVETIKRYVMSGIGITVLPLMAVADDLRLVVQMIWNKNRWASRALQVFLDTTLETWGSLSNASIAD